MKDRAIRAITADGAFRVITIRATDTVQAAIEAQEVGGADAALFAELLTGAVLVRETMSPQNRVQVILKPQEGEGAMVADSHPEGLTRGLVTREEGAQGPMALGEGVRLQVIRVLHNQQLSQGIVATSSAEGVSGALTTYMLNSEQIVSTIEVACHMEEGRVVSAAGFIVQLLPEVSREVLTPMTERLAEREALREIIAEHGADPERLLANLLAGFEHTVLEEEPVSWGCTCSEMRIVQAMATLSREELTEIVDSGGFLKVDCEYCGTSYNIGASQLEPLLGVQ